MSVTSKVRSVPRGVVSTSLQLARLPLSAVSRAARQQGNEQWPPTLAFEGFEAGVETVVGSLLRDDTLVSRGRVRQAKVAQIRKAAELETLADQQREQADAKFAAKREDAQRKRESAEKQADQRERQLEQQAEERKRQAQTKAAKKAAAAAKVKSAQDQAIDRVERNARSEALSKETEALAATKQALEAEETVAVIDQTLDGTKEERKTG
jgi:hypothetical protein